MITNKTCAIVGAGPGNGLSLGRKFTEQGYAVALLARNQQNLDDLRKDLPGVHTYACDVTDAESVRATFDELQTELGHVDTLIYNAGSGVFGSIDDLDAQGFEQAWRVNTLGCFHCVKSVLAQMRDAGGGNIVVIGATAAKRGGARFAAFAPAKAAQYMLAQSLARHLGPDRIHVSYIVIDGVIDNPRSRHRWGDKPEEFFLKADHIAESVYQVCQQPHSAWTFEFDVRPYCEKW